MDEEVGQEVLKVIQSGQLAQGPRVEEFEKAFAGYIGTKYAVAVNSGTAGLHVALLAAGIQPGDEVITTPFSFIATANCCLFCNAVPVFADIDNKTFNISPAAIEKKITSKTKAVIIVHLFGQACEMEEISEICRKHNIILIEDACQAHGAIYKGKKVGSFGIGCFSFYPTKNMTTGEGGMVTTNDENIARLSKMIRAHGQAQRYIHDMLGFNYRMTDIAAIIGICQLKKLDDANAKRLKNARYLTENLGKIKGIIPPYIASECKHVFHQYTIKVTENYKMSRDDLQKKMLAKGIGTGIHYPIPIHKQPLYQKLGYNDIIPIAETVSRQVLSLPVHPYLTEEDLQTIVKVIKEV
jgi:perosamine synthetase